MTWIEAVPALLAAVAVLLLPGGLLAVAVGLRGFALLAVAPALSVAVLAVAAIAFDGIAVDWSPAAVAVASVGVALVAALARLLVARLSRPRQASPPPGSRIAVGWPIIGLVVGCAVVGTQLVIALGSPDAVSQTFDALFHLNAIRYISDTASASSFHLTTLILAPGRSSFYPGGWHAAASLVQQLSGASVPASANSVDLVVATLVWVSGSVLLSTVLFPGRRAAPVLAGSLAGAFPGFPLLPLDYGVLFPYFLSLALVPAVLAVAVSLSRLRGLIGVGVAAELVLVAVGLVGVGLAQPAGALAACALLIPLLVALTVATFARSGARPAPIGLALGTVAAVAALAAVWRIAGRIGENGPWAAHATPADGALETLAHAPLDRPAALVASGLVVVGLLASTVRPRSLWIAAMWAIPAGLYFVSAVIDREPLRTLLVGPFYSNSQRLAALMIPMAVQLAVAGALAALGLATALLRRARARSGTRGARVGAAAVGAAAVAGLVLATQGAAVRGEVERAATTYGLDPAILSQDEYDLIERLPREVESDAVIAGSGWTGTSLAYALADRMVLAPHFNVSNDPRKVIVNTRLNAALTDPEVCPAVRELDVGYVLDFGWEAGGAGPAEPFDGLVDYPGLTGLADSGAVELVDEEGDARLYRVTAC